MQEKQRIAVVDDEEDMRALISELIEMSGYTAICFSTCEGLCGKLETGAEFDLILSDKVFVGHLDGVSCAKQLAASGNSTPMIIMTGEGELPIKELPTNVKSVMTKPFGFKELQKCLTSVLQPDSTKS